MISKDRGFNCAAYKESSLKRRLAIRMRANEIDSYMDYARFLKGNDKEYKKLLDVLTVNGTGFFRDSSVFKAFGEKFLPTIIERKEAPGQAGDKNMECRLRFWGRGLLDRDCPEGILGRKG